MRTGRLTQGKRPSDGELQRTTGHSIQYLAGQGRELARFQEVVRDNHRRHREGSTRQVVEVDKPHQSGARSNRTRWPRGRKQSSSHLTAVSSGALPIASNTTWTPAPSVRRLT